MAPNAGGEAGESTVEAGESTVESVDLEFELLGWPAEGPSLRLDYRAFSYAGKFATSNAGTAVLRSADGNTIAPDWEPDRPLPEGLEPGSFADDIAAAVSFDADRTDPTTLRLRYVSVHRALRGTGLGPRLLGHLLERFEEKGEYERVRIAVNNPFAYEALYKVGFAFTGRETGLAEVVLERPIRSPATTASDTEAYQSGLDRFRDRHEGESGDGSGFTGAEASFLASRLGSAPPESGE